MDKKKRDLSEDESDSSPLKHARRDVSGKEPRRSNEIDRAELIQIKDDLEEAEYKIAQNDMKKCLRTPTEDESETIKSLWKSIREDIRDDGIDMLDIIDEGDLLLYLATKRVMNPIQDDDDDDDEDSEEEGEGKETAEIGAEEEEVEEETSIVVPEGVNTTV
jgi:hypothetical protein